MIKRVRRFDKNSHDSSIDEFCMALDINTMLGWSEEFSKRVREHYLIKWYCTDTWVGTCVYYMDDEPIAISTQDARKSDKIYEFISEEAASKVRDFILELIAKDYPPCYDLIDMNKDVDEFYSVSYTGQLLEPIGMFEGRKCTLIKKPKGGLVDGVYHVPTTIIVYFEDGTHKEIDVKDFKIKVNIA